MPTGVPMRRKTPRNCYSVEAHARELIMAGKTPRETGAITGCSMDTVYRLRQEMREAGEHVPAVHRKNGARNDTYEKQFKDWEDDMSGERCARCGLRLPCNACLPTTAAAYAGARREHWSDGATTSSYETAGRPRKWGA